MHQNIRQHFLLYNLVKNEAESQAVFAVSYVRNVRGRAMLPDSTVCIHQKVFKNTMLSQLSRHHMEHQ